WRIPCRAHPTPPRKDAGKHRLSPSPGTARRPSSTCRTALVDLATGCPFERSTTPPPQTAGYSSRCGRDRPVCRGNAAPSSPTGRRSRQIVPSEASITLSLGCESLISTDPSRQKGTRRHLGSFAFGVTNLYRCSSDAHYVAFPDPHCVGGVCGVTNCFGRAFVTDLVAITDGKEL